MPDQTLLSVLHISDFHFTKKKLRDQQIVVDALTNDLKTLCIGHRRPDIILFTGDLVQAAGMDRHDDAYDFVIEPVAKATGASDERIFLVPGNHDLSWKTLEQHGEAHRGWRSALGKADEMALINHEFEKGAFGSAVEAKFSDFFELERYMGGEERLAKSSAAVLGAHVDPEMPVRFDFVEVQELRRSDMRQLLVQFDKCDDVEEWLDRLQSEFREINLPFRCDRSPTVCPPTYKGGKGRGAAG